MSVVYSAPPPVSLMSMPMSMPSTGPSPFPVVIQVGADPNHRMMFSIHPLLLTSQLMSAIQQSISPYSHTMVTSISNSKQEVIPLQGQVAMYVHPHEVLMANVVATMHMQLPIQMQPYAYAVPPQPATVQAPYNTPHIQTATPQPMAISITPAKTLSYRTDKPLTQRQNQKRRNRSRKKPINSNMMSGTPAIDIVAAPVELSTATSTPSSSVSVLSSVSPVSSPSASLPAAVFPARVDHHAIMDTDVDTDNSDSTSINSHESWTSTDTPNNSSGDKNSHTHIHTPSKRSRHTQAAVTEAPETGGAISEEVEAARLIAGLSQQGRRPRSSSPIHDTDVSVLESNKSSPDTTTHSSPTVSMLASPPQQLSRLSLDHVRGKTDEAGSSQEKQHPFDVSPVLYSRQLKHLGPMVVYERTEASHGENSSKDPKGRSAKDHAVTLPETVALPAYTVRAAEMKPQSTTITQSMQRRIELQQQTSSITPLSVAAAAVPSVPLRLATSPPSFSLARLKTLTPEHAAVQRVHGALLPDVQSKVVDRKEARRLRRLKGRANNRQRGRQTHPHVTAVSFSQPSMPYMTALAVPAITLSSPLLK